MAYHPFRHLGLKILAVGLALGLWLAVAGEQVVERSLRAPLELQNKPELLELVENPPAQIDVRVRGAAGLLSHLQAGDVVAMIDLSTARSGRKIFHLTPAQVRAPFGVEITQVTPGSVSLVFEPTLTKVIPVVPVIEGEPAPGFAVGQVTIEPARVEVTGPESALRHLRDATTEPVSVAGATRRVRESVNIGVSDASVRLNSPISGTVTVQVQPAPVDRVVSGVPLRTRHLGKGLAALPTPAAVSVSLRGPHDVLQRLGPDAVPAYVDLAGLRPGRYNLPVRIELPQNVAVVQTNPASVRVRIK